MKHNGSNDKKPNIESNDKSKGPPSLFGVTVAAGEEQRPVRILSTIKGEKGNGSSRRPFNAKAVALALIIFPAIGYLVYKGANEATSKRSSVPQIASVETPSATTSLPSTPAVKPTEAPTPEPATIVSEPTERKVDKASALAAPATNSPTETAAAALTKETAAKNTAQPVKAVATIPTTHQRAAVSATKVSAANATQSPTIKTAKDPDVDLIQALLTHGSKTTKDTKATSSTKSHTKLAKANQNTRLKQDVAITTPVPTMQDQVDQCRAKGFLEGELCRLRICSDRWGKNPACPVMSLNEYSGP